MNVPFDELGPREMAATALGNAIAVQVSENETQAVALLDRIARALAGRMLSHREAAAIAQTVLDCLLKNQA